MYLGSWGTTTVHYLFPKYYTANFPCLGFLHLTVRKKTLLNNFFILSFYVSYIYNHIYPSPFAVASLPFFIACRWEGKNGWRAAEIRTRAWLTASQRTSNWATLHPNNTYRTYLFCRELSPEPSLRPLEWGNFSISPAAQGTTVDNTTCHRLRLSLWQRRSKNVTRLWSGLLKKIQAGPSLIPIQAYKKV